MKSLVFCLLGKTIYDIGSSKSNNNNNSGGLVQLAETVYCVDGTGGLTPPQSVLAIRIVGSIPTGVVLAIRIVGLIPTR